jgi:hypothetical protein
MGKSPFLIWGMVVLCGGCSLDSAIPRTHIWYLNQNASMTEYFQASVFAVSSNPAPRGPNSVDETLSSKDLTENNKSPSGSGTSPQPVPAPSEQKPAILVPESPNQDNGQVIVAYKSKIDETHNLLRTIDESQLSKEQHDTYVSINSFLEKAQEAFSQNDLSMAVNLSEKAHTLAKEIVSNFPKP